MILLASCLRSGFVLSMFIGSGVNVGKPFLNYLVFQKLDWQPGKISRLSRSEPNTMILKKLLVAMFFTPLDLFRERTVKMKRKASQCGVFAHSV